MPPACESSFRYPGASSARRRSGESFQCPARRKYRRRIRSLRRKASALSEQSAARRAAGSRSSENCSGRSKTRADRGSADRTNLSEPLGWLRREPACGNDTLRGLAFQTRSHPQGNCQPGVPVIKFIRGKEIVVSRIDRSFGGGGARRIFLFH